MQCPDCGSTNIVQTKIASVFICAECAKTDYRETFESPSRSARHVIARLLIIAAIAVVLFLIVWIAVSTLFPGILPIGFEIDDSGAWICTYLPTITGDCYPIWDRTGA